MFGDEGWTIAIIGVAAYLAVTSLVRLMNRRHSALIDELSQQIEAEQQRRKEAKRQEDRQRIRDQLRQKRAG